MLYRVIALASDRRLASGSRRASLMQLGPRRIGFCRPGHGYPLSRFEATRFREKRIELDGADIAGPLQTPAHVRRETMPVTAG
jgi:hypothetical protein